MDCSQVKALLSEYLDGMLEEETRALVEEHLSACGNCREEHDSLKALVQELGSMDPIVPPANFLGRLHERMEQPSRISRLIQTLFVPVRFKIPLEFAAAGLVAVVIFSILNIQFGAYKAPQAPVQDMQEQAVGEKAYPKSAAGTFRKEAPAPSIPQEGAIAKGRAMETRPPELDILLTPKRVSGGMKSPTLKASPQLAWEQQEPRTANVVRPKSEGTDLMREKAGAAPGISSPEDKAPFSRSFSNAVTQEVKNAVVRAGGRIVAGDKTRQKGTSQEVIASIPVKNYPFLLEKLHAVGTLQVPSEMPSQEEEGPLQVRIKLLPEK